MLQNPSKYHPNPLSHFLALHNSQTQVHHVHTMPNVVAGPSHGNLPSFLHHHSTVHLSSQQNGGQSHPQQHNQHLPHHLSGGNLQNSHAQLMDTNGTSLDVGKSFTIAAILGLQKSAIEGNRKDYNNVINLSMNAHTTIGYQQRDQRTSNSNAHDVEKTEPRSVSVSNGSSSCNSNNNNNSCNTHSVTSKGNSGICGTFNFNCDNNAAAAALVNRYLPAVNATNGSASSFSATHQHKTQVRATNFAAAAAAAVAAAANAGNTAPSALQSLQQLHQQHAQQTNLTFQREKLKPETCAKKSSMKNKRVRTIFTPEQLERLEAEFERQQYMVGPERLYLAHTLQLTEAQVKVWFQNRRIKWRKHHLEITQQRLALLRQNQLATGSGVVQSNAHSSSPEHRATLSTPTPSCEDDVELKPEDQMQKFNNNRHDSESDLSICNDSMDADSVVDGSEET